MLSSAALLIGLSSLISPQPVDDPVLKIQAQRQTQRQTQRESTPDGLRTVQEPPPLPPIESHVKDTRGYRVSRKARATARKSRRTKASRTQKGRAQTSKKTTSNKTVKKQVRRKR